MKNRPPGSSTNSMPVRSWTNSSSPLSGLVLEKVKPGGAEEAVNGSRVTTPASVMPPAKTATLSRKASNAWPSTDHEILSDSSSPTGTRTSSEKKPLASVTAVSPKDVTTSAPATRAPDSSTTKPSTVVSTTSETTSRILALIAPELVA